MSRLLTRRRFTIDEYYCMAQAGILHEDDRVELIEGEIIEMSPIGSRHVACVNRTARWFDRGVGDRAIVSVQNPIRLSRHSEPQPDVALLRTRPDFYASALPGPGDVLLVIEMADTSLAYDRRVKLPLYAEAGIPEVWIVDLTQERIQVHRDPHRRRYQHVMVFARGPVLTPLAFSDLRVPVEDLLP